VSGKALVVWVFYLLVFFEGGLGSVEVDLQLFPPVFLLSQTSLEKSQSLLAAVPEGLQTWCQGTTKHLHNLQADGPGLRLLSACEIEITYILVKLEILSKLSFIDEYRI